MEDICTDIRRGNFGSASERSSDYKSSWESAGKLLDSLKEAVGKKKRPDLKKLKEEAETAENRWKAAEERKNRCQSLQKNNQEVYAALAPAMEERGRRWPPTENWTLFTG